MTMIKTVALLALLLRSSVAATNDDVSGAEQPVPTSVFTPGFDSHAVIGTPEPPIDLLREEPTPSPTVYRWRSRSTTTPEEATRGILPEGAWNPTIHPKQEAQPPATMMASRSGSGSWDDGAAGSFGSGSTSRNSSSSGEEDKDGDDTIKFPTVDRSTAGPGSKEVSAVVAGVVTLLAWAVM